MNKVTYVHFGVIFDLQIWKASILPSHPVILMREQILEVIDGFISV